MFEAGKGDKREEVIGNFSARRENQRLPHGRNRIGGASHVLLSNLATVETGAEWGIGENCERGENPNKKRERKRWWRSDREEGWPPLGIPDEDVARASERARWNYILTASFVRSDQDY